MALSNLTLKQADMCVKCGLCLPHCPTYQVHQLEPQSPRGRIALIDAIATLQVTDLDASRDYIDDCLNCGNCERVCPAKVPYNQLIDQARSILPLSPKLNWQARLIRKLVLYPRWWVTFWRLFKHPLGHVSLMVAKWLGQPLDIHKQRLNTALEPSLARPANNPSHTTTIRLFVGCTGNTLDTQTLNSSINLLRKLGIAAELPSPTTCCGAIHQHTGQISQANRLAAKNIQQFKNDHAVLSFASGCGASLQAYNQLDNVAGAEEFTAKHFDILNYLFSKQLLQSCEFTPLAQTIGIWEPCTHKNNLRTAHDISGCLKLIPQLHMVSLSSMGCCGAAGIQSLQQSAGHISEPLTRPAIEQIRLLGITQLVTSNIGCALQFEKSLHKAGLDIRVVHPVTLLDEQLQSR